MSSVNLPPHFLPVIVRGSWPTACAGPHNGWFEYLAGGQSTGGKTDVPEVTVSAATIIVIVVVLVILAVAAAAASFLIRRKTIERDQFGPEYERLAKEIGARKAKAEFARRRQRVDGLGIASLSDEKRSAYARRWDAAQERFIDSPAQAVNMADSLVTAVAAERGYQAADDEVLLEDLSVYHGRHLDGYRAARLTNGRAAQGVTTEGRRRALLAYRALFFDMLEMPGDGLARAALRRAPDRTGADRTGADRRAAEQRAADQAAIDRAAGNSAAAADQAPDRPAWKAITQGWHWKTQRADSDDVAATRR
jgi:flagellar basal body-associated protein FliL